MQTSAFWRSRQWAQLVRLRTDTRGSCRLATESLGGPPMASINLPPVLRSSASALCLIYGVTALQMLCTATQAPMLPYLWSQLGGTNVGYGLLMTEFGALQLCGNLFSGPYVDKLGARVWLAISFAAAVCSFTLTAVASNVWMMYLSRVPGILELAVLCARTLVSERSADEDRARLLGYVGVCLGAGFALGPYIGGILSRISLQLCAWFAAGVTLLCIGLVPLIPPVQEGDYRLVTEDQEMQASAGLSQHLEEADSMLHDASHDMHLADSHSTHRKRSGMLDLQPAFSLGNSHMPVALRQELQSAGSMKSQHSGTGSKRRSFTASRAVSGLLDAQSGLLDSQSEELQEAVGIQLEESAAQMQSSLAEPSSEAGMNLQHIMETCRKPGVPSLLFIKVLVALGLGVLQTTLALLLQQHYKLDTQGNGMVLSYVGVIIIVVQGTVIGPVSRRLSVRQVVVSFGWGTVLSFAATAAAVHLWMLLAALPFLCVSVLLVETICTAQLTKIVPADSKGTVLALDAALLGGATMVAPSIGSSLFQLVGFSCVGISGAIAGLVMVALVHLRILEC